MKVCKTNLNYNLGLKVLGHFPFFTCFCMEFVANWQYTLINMALPRFCSPTPSPPPRSKLRPITCGRYVKGVGQFKFLRNCSLTPPLSQHFALSEKKVNVRLGEG